MRSTGSPTWRLATIVPVALAGACSASPPPAVEVALGPVQMLAPPPPTPAEIAARATPEQAAAAQEGQGCASKPALRDRALCYLESGSEESIDPLFAIGRELAPRMASQAAAYRPDFVYAAENAGVLAAKSRDARLYTGLRSAGASDQLFAVHAIRHMLATLRFGYAHGKDADAAVRAERVEAARAGCASMLGAGDEEMLKAAADCLGEIGDPRDAAGVIDAMVSHPTVGVEKHLVEVVAQLSPVPKASLQKLTPVLEKKLAVDWTHDDLWLRARMCRLLLAEVPAGDTWPKKPAQVAVREIGNRNSQARAPCEDLATRKK
jgi:hypothetical protein